MYTGNLKLHVHCEVSLIPILTKLAEKVYVCLGTLDLHINSIAGSPNILLWTYANFYTCMYM